MAARKVPAFLVACDSRSDQRVFSGSTFHLALEGVRGGLLNSMVNLYPRGVAAWPVYARAGWWKLKGGVHGRHGFKFTDGFLDGIWKQKLTALRDSLVINNFQLFGSHFLQSHQNFGIEPCFYIDGTLNEYFGDYRDFDTAQIDESAMRQALVLEREGYAHCRDIVVMSNRTAASIKRDYDVPAHKIHMVPPGANIPEDRFEAFDDQPERHPAPDRKSLTLGFVGLYPERKGLPVIADAVRLLRRGGYDTRLHVIGRCPPEIAQQDGVSYFGLIDKGADLNRFVGILRNVDLGCMLSRAELTGIALLEFLRMGVPILATDVGGIPEILELGAGKLVSPQVSADELAQHLAALIDEPGQLAELQERAWHRRHNASWRRSVRELKRVLSQ
jgi:glycosyltransferase involved in cell wall biosynthesis